MNSLFVRTLLWFIATVILTFVAMTIATVLDMDGSQRRRGPFGSWLTLQLAEAAHAYETGGRDSLAAALDRFQAVTETRGVLTDARGRDLLTGEDHSGVLNEMRERRSGPAWTR